MVEHVRGTKISSAGPFCLNPYLYICVPIWQLVLHCKIHIVSLFTYIVNVLLILCIHASLLKACQFIFIIVIHFTTISLYVSLSKYVMVLVSLQLYRIIHHCTSV